MQRVFSSSQQRHNAVSPRHVRWSTSKLFMPDNVNTSCNQSLRKWSNVFPHVCLFLILPLSPHAPCMWPLSQLHPKPRTFSLGTKACAWIPLTPWQWSSPSVVPHWAQSPQGPTSWSQQHQREPGSRGWVEPDLTLLPPLHHNVWVCSRSLTLTFSMICVYQWCPPPRHIHMSLPLLPDTWITQLLLVNASQ